MKILLQTDEEDRKNFLYSQNFKCSNCPQAIKDRAIVVVKLDNDQFISLCTDCLQKKCPTFMSAEQISKLNQEKNKDHTYFLERKKEEIKKIKEDWKLFKTDYKILTETKLKEGEPASNEEKQANNRLRETLSKVEITLVKDITQEILRNEKYRNYRPVDFRREQAKTINAINSQVRKAANYSATDRRIMHEANRIRQKFSVSGCYIQKNSLNYKNFDKLVVDSVNNNGWSIAAIEKISLRVKNIDQLIEAIMQPFNLVDYESYFN